MTDHSRFIGIDLGGTKTEIVILDSDSQELLRKRSATPAGDYRAVLENIASMVADAEARLGASNLPVGIGIPGTISRHTGLIKNSNSTCLNGQPFQSDIEALLGRAVAISNDANCLAVSEAVDGAGRDHRTVFAAILGTGCGAGIAIDKQALNGANGIAGEWGHIPMPGVSDSQRQSRPCYCGQSGCVETFLSGTGLALTHQQLHQTVLSAEEIHRLAEQGHIAAQDTLGQYQQHLLSGLTLIINILDPDIIVLGGGVSNIQSLYPYLNRQLPESVFGRECDTRVVASNHGDSSGVRGAAWLNR